MTLDDAIKHAEEVAEEKFDNAVYIMDKTKSDVALSNVKKCRKCAEEHHQLAEWLKELKAYKEQSGDVISRQATINEIARWKGYLDADMIMRIQIGIKRLPSAQSEQRWIPVSERLPEEYEYVLLCDREPGPDEDTGYSRMAVGWLEDGEFCCWDDRAARKEFVAWMSLPKPYKEGEHE